MAVAVAVGWCEARVPAGLLVRLLLWGIGLQPDWLLCRLSSCSSQPTASVGATGPHAVQFAGNSASDSGPRLLAVGRQPPSTWRQQVASSVPSHELADQRESALRRLAVAIGAAAFAVRPTSAIMLAYLGLRALWQGPASQRIRFILCEALPIGYAPT